ncbi:hypothetical protein DM02DRAFT_559416 [Periconia macrospinosa]|uniref:S-adenosyl-L-methionine-dependent methyltransferase n=1 Tax=Periconia macrospinosa TaxID=97972 RepID=A0A2V1DWT9_9PLEO|nr:hypothetical protein DM02DRAFT_559416 [Periconia macrospinosa]
MSTGPDITAASKTGTNDDNVIFGAEQTEVERLDMQHKVIHDANPRCVYAPLDLSKGGYKILDQATGSGIWIRDARAEAGADNEWVGTDIEDQWFPTTTPADTTYKHQSMTEPWPVQWKGSFDLVHSRMALPGVGINSLESAVKNLIALVKPGGWIQMCELEWDGWNIGPEGKIFATAVRDLFTTVSAGQGVDLREKLIPIFKEAGLENIDYTIVVTPFGARASDKIRKTSEASLFATALGVSTTTKMLPPISIPREQLDAMPQKLLEETKKEGWEYKHFVLWAQKPLKA